MNRIDRGGAPPKGVGGQQVEGRQAVRELLLAGTRQVREVWIAAEQDSAPILDDIRDLAREQKVRLEEVSRRRLDDAAHSAGPQGVIAFARSLPEYQLDGLCARPSFDGGPAFLLAVDGVTDPGNLGTIIRTAECAGVSGLILPRHRAANVTATVAKAAAGAVEHVPMAVVGGLAAAIDQMRRLGVWVVGLDSAASAPIYSLAVSAEPICLVLGSEGTGLSRLVAQRCDQLVTIPQYGQLDSLNVASAGSIALFEIVRQRRYREGA